jgi:hypothetical protein
VNRGYTVVVPIDCVAADPAPYTEPVLQAPLRNIAFLTSSSVLAAAWTRTPGIQRRTARAGDAICIDRIYSSGQYEVQDSQSTRKRIRDTLGPLGATALPGVLSSLESLLGR